MSEDRSVEEGLARLCRRLAWAPPQGVERLSGGASQETWAFSCADQRFILRRAPGGRDNPVSTQGVGLAAEAAVIAAARAAGAPTPIVAAALTAEDGLGRGYVMERLEGETLARRLQRDAAFAPAREVFARDAGAAAAAIHATPPQTLPPLPHADAAAQLDLYEATYRRCSGERPVMELAFAWLRKHLPSPAPPCLVHGDFRLGNLMVAPQGLVAALDWELTHLGDPAEDLGWICVPSWRFGALEAPVGGIGAVDDLLAAYRKNGGAPSVTLERIRFWTLFGALKWGVMCLTMAEIFETRTDPSVERAAIGRRASEAELDFLLLLQNKL